MRKVFTYLILLMLFILCIVIKLNFSIDKPSNSDLDINVKYQDQDIKMKVPKGTNIKDIKKVLNIDSNEYTKLYGDIETVYDDENIEFVKVANRISINNASIDELVMLPGIGNTIAQRIIDYRLKIGRFEYLEELKQVKGIGNKKYEKIKELICL